MTDVIMTGDPERLPIIIDESMLPGRLTLGQLAINGIVTMLDHRCGYVTMHAQTLAGRAQIVASLIPPHTLPCMRLAQWVWIGGRFPDAIELATQAHYRTEIHGRLVRTYKRSVDESHRARIGELTLTSPTRTACDLSCRDETGTGALRQHVLDLCKLMDEWNISAEECARMLRGNPRWPRRRHGLALFAAFAELERLQRKSEEDDAERTGGMERTGGKGRTGGGMGRTGGTRGTGGTSNASS